MPLIQQLLDLLQLIELAAAVVPGAPCPVRGQQAVTALPGAQALYRNAGQFGDRANAVEILGGGVRTVQAVPKKVDKGPLIVQVDVATVQVGRHTLVRVYLESDSGKRQIEALKKTEKREKARK